MAVMALTPDELAYHVNLMELNRQEQSEEDYIIDYEMAFIGSGLGGGYTVSIR